MNDFICVYDSGLGGLIETSKIINDNPKCDIYYLGDFDNAPYGNKTKEELTAIFDANLKKIKEKGIKEVVVACNTMCSAIDFKRYQDFKIYDIIDMTIDSLKGLNKNSHLLVCATPFTINKGRYQNELHNIGFENISSLSLDRLAYMLETFESETKIKEYLFKEFKKIDIKIDGVILACTHYPIVINLFKEYFNVPIYSSMDIDFKLDHKGNGQLLIDMPYSSNLKRFIDKYIRKEVSFCQKKSY